MSQTLMKLANKASFLMPLKTFPVHACPTHIDANDATFVVNMNLNT